MATPHVPLFDLGCKITTKIRYAQTFTNVLRKKRNTRTNKGRHEAEEWHAPIAYRPAHFLHVKEKQGYKTPLLPYKKALLPYKFLRNVRTSHVNLPLILPESATRCVIWPHISLQLRSKY